MISISSDIWSEDSKSLLALIVHLIDSNFKLHDILIYAKPFSKVAHAAINIEHGVKEVLTSYKIAEYDKSRRPHIDTVILNLRCLTCFLYCRVRSYSDITIVHDAKVGNEVHGSTTNAASNMKVAFESFEGASCVDHKI